MAGRLQTIDDDRICHKCGGQCDTIICDKLNKTNRCCICSWLPDDYLCYSCEYTVYLLRADLKKEEYN